MLGESDLIRVTRPETPGQLQHDHFLSLTGVETRVEGVVLLRASAEYLEIACWQSTKVFFVFSVKCKWQISDCHDALTAPTSPTSHTWRSLGGQAVCPSVPVPALSCDITNSLQL